jgi:multiple sugar transport system permease protein
MSTTIEETPQRVIPVPAGRRPKPDYGVAPERHRRGPGVWLALAAVCIMSVGYLFPLIWMFSTSIKPLDQTMRFPPQFLPDGNVSEWSKTAVNNYWRVINHDKMDFPLYTRNTLFIAAMSIIGTVISCSLVAYGFAKIKFKGRGAMFALMLSTMMIPFPVLMVPLFTIYTWMGDHTPIQMLGTLRPLWLPAFFGSAFHIFLLRQFYLTIPEELSEAARIDGCSELGIWWRIVLPLSKPALTVVALFTFMGVWNDFFRPLVFLQHPDHYTLSLGLQVFQGTHGGTEWNLLMAASLLILTPVIVLFFLAQKTFIQGIATTGMKG